MGPGQCLRSWQIQSVLVMVVMYLVALIIEFVYIKKYYLLFFLLLYLVALGTSAMLLMPEVLGLCEHGL